MKLLGFTLAMMFSSFGYAQTEEPEVDCKKDYGVKTPVDVCGFDEENINFISQYVTIQECKCVDRVPLDKVEELNLSGQSLTKLPVQALSTLRGLTKIDVSNNQLPSMQIGHFKFSKKLEILNLANNQIKKFGGIGTFAGMTSLKVLDLSGNQITDIPFGATQGLTLDVLNLSNNKIAQMDPDAFQSSSILSLDLSKNSLREIPMGVFSPLSTLQKIDISENILTEINTKNAGLNEKAQVDGVKSTN